MKGPAMNEERRVRELSGGLAFDPGFRDRVMSRVRALAEEERVPPRGVGPGLDLVYLHLSGIFPRLAAACLVCVTAIGVYTLIGDPGLAGSTLESLLGLPAETLGSALALGSP